MKKKLILGIVFMLGLTMVSCGNSNSSSNSASETTSSSSSSIEESAEKENDSEEKKEEETDSKESTDTASESTKEETKMPIYTVDVNTYEPNEEKTISVKADATLEEKLNAVAKSVSETNFDNLPIEVKSIDTINGKKVAVMNLSDSGDKKWNQYFQGSAGGQMTTSALFENFLQTNNKSNTEWIDGVQFLYNNEKIEYEHVADLSEIKYR